MSAHLRVIETPRCRGRCCRGFSIYKIGADPPYAYTHAEILERSEALAHGEFLADMLIPVQGPLLERKHPRFNCRHLLENGDCAVYADRPTLCRRHGVNTDCSSKDCPLEANVLGTWVGELRREWASRETENDRRYIRNIVKHIRKLEEQLNEEN